MVSRAMAVAVWNREPIIVAVAQRQQGGETYGFAGSTDQVMLEGQLLRPPGQPARTLFVFVHPTSTLQLMPVPAALADAGQHVLCAATRYAKNDSALIFEKVALDLGAYLQHARKELGYRTIVLVGWSGGGSTVLFYQAQAEEPSITHTPAGDLVNLIEAKLPRADGVIFIAAHLGRAEVLTEWLDPSVMDEADPDIRDPELDIYSPEPWHSPPYAVGFIERFRVAQIARNRRITAWAEAMLEALRSRATAETERGFVTHRTMCDVRWLDPTIEPNGRKPGWCYLGDPQSVNVGPVGLARFSTLRSWLSQWSYDRSNVKGAENAAGIRQTPVLQIVNGADDAVPASHNTIIHAALRTRDKEMVNLDGATHYYVGQPVHLQSCIGTILGWCERKGFLSYT